MKELRNFLQVTFSGQKIYVGAEFNRKMRKLDMKSLLLLFFFCACANANDLRLIGTNLYDFSLVSSGKVFCVYHIAGTVARCYPKAATIQYCSGIKYRVVWTNRPYTPGWAKPMIEHFTGESWHELDLQRQIELQSSEDDAKAYQIAQKIVTFPPDVQVRAYNAFLGSPVTDFLEPVAITNSIQLLNYPPNYSAGKKIDCLAVPTSTPGLWDYGQPFNGDPAAFHYIYRVLPDHISRERLYTAQERETMKQAAIKRLLSWQQEQASNDVASVQFDLGLRYLKADGVESNRTTALYWIRKSAAQNYIPALEFLKNNPR